MPDTFELTLDMGAGAVRVIFPRAMNPYTIKLALAEVLRGNLTNHEGAVGFETALGCAPHAAQVVHCADGKGLLAMGPISMTAEQLAALDRGCKFTTLQEYKGD